MKVLAIPAPLIAAPALAPPAARPKPFKAVAVLEADVERGLKPQAAEFPELMAVESPGPEKVFDTVFPVAKPPNAAAATLPLAAAEPKGLRDVEPALPRVVESPSRTLDTLLVLVVAIPPPRAAAAALASELARPPSPAAADEASELEPRALG